MSSPSAQNAAGPNQFAQIIMLARGYAPAVCLYAAAKLGIADLLAGGPKPVSDLARSTQTNEDALYRCLRALASIDVFRETAPRTFAETQLSEALRDAAGSARDAVLFMADPMHMNIYGELMHTIKTGGTAFKKVTGMEPFEFFQQNADENKSFNNAMTSLSRQFIQPVIEVYDFGEAGTLADIGGGHGSYSARLVERYPRFGEAPGLVVPDSQRAIRRHRTRIGGALFLELHPDVVVRLLLRCGGERPCSERQQHRHEGESRNDSCGGTENSVFAEITWQCN